MAGNNNILTLTGVHFSYNDNREILTDINFYLPKGELLGIIGPNGSGKTTLLKVISGILKPKKGKYLFSIKTLINFPLSKLPNSSQ
jgi:ABC-type cobalamin/Fe3+-siderophores transport systems, ATPase components